MEKYNPKQIEAKWQKIWKQKKLYVTQDAVKNKKNFYKLVEFPYPSGNLHMGHWYSFAVPDIFARYKRMKGYNVMYPIGFDAFGLPAENAAIQRGINPADWTKENIKAMTAQMESMGAMFDWSRMVSTIDPEYYRWTQWIFLQFYKTGLAYRAKTLVNWCPKDKTVLANEQVVDGKCDRCGSVVEQREREQWMYKITKYADALVDGLEKVDWPEMTKTAQRNWIGRSEGAIIKFKLVSDLPHTPSQGRGSLPSGESQGGVESEEGGIPGYITSDTKEYPELYAKALEMRKNPTEGEKILWQALKANKQDHHFRRQHVVDHFIVDFLCLRKKLVIEVDGDIHDYQKERDAERTNTFSALGYTVLRFSNREILENLDNVLEKINSSLRTPSPWERDGERSEVGEISVFTTRPDTIFGATYLVLAPEHELVEKLKAQMTNVKEVEEYIKQAKRKTALQRQESREKTGVELKGITAINPANGEEIPVWVADYVLGSYGTGAIMAVPAHDQRDFEFAKEYRLPISDAPLVDSKEIVKKIGGVWKTQYRLRDWILSRQRYWGTPIPMIICKDCGYQPVPEEELPVKLPKLDNYLPADDGSSPLARAEKWKKTKCPNCGKDAERETDTMDTFVDSSWYYLAYATRGISNFQFPISNNSWLPIDLYTGGAEHNTMHLLYSRFFIKALHELGLVDFDEPFTMRRNHGIVLGPDGQKMSKSKGNVVDPDKEVAQYGADTVRMYLAFLGPYDTFNGPWEPHAINGIARFLQRVWRVYQNANIKNQNDNAKLKNVLHKTIKKVGEDIENLHFNTAISELMKLLNEREIVDDIFLKLLAPFAPHLTEELWMRDHAMSIHLEPWPQYDPALIEETMADFVIQVNGRTRGVIQLPSDSDQWTVQKSAEQDEKVKHHLTEPVEKVIFVPRKLLNLLLRRT